jgi:peptide/nickel transport system permease protein
MDALMALPSLLLAMLILTTVGSNPVYVVLAIALVFIPRSARVVRGVALSLAASEFVDAARVRGESAAYIIFREMLPNSWAPIIVELTIRFGYAILLIASLGFLGLGARPPTPDWGLLVNEALPFLSQAPWLAILPAIAISTAVVGANLVGDGIRDALALRQSGQAL